jgi:hypothetical protein
MTAHDLLATNAAEVQPDVLTRLRLRSVLVEGLYAGDDDDARLAAVRKPDDLDAHPDGATYPSWSTSRQLAAP